MTCGRMPATGGRFPDFVLPDSSGCLHRAPDGRSIIVFYRGHWCGICRRQFGELARHAAHFRRLHVPIIAISSDDPESLDQMSTVTGTSICFLSDRDGNVIERLGLRDPEEQDRGTIAVPSMFLLDSRNIVQFHYRARSPEDRPKIELLMLAAEQLR